jgi:hypothetical protein
LRYPIGGRERLAALDLVGKPLRPLVPIGDLEQDPGDRPAVVHPPAQVVVAGALDEPTQALKRAAVAFDLACAFGHGK